MAQLYQSFELCFTFFLKRTVLKSSSITVFCGDFCMFALKIVSYRIVKERERPRKKKQYSLWRFAVCTLDKNTLKHVTRAFAQLFFLQQFAYSFSHSHTHTFSGESVNVFELAMHMREISVSYSLSYKIRRYKINNSPCKLNAMWDKIPSACPYAMNVCCFEF